MFSLNGSRFLDTMLEIRRIKTQIEGFSPDGRNEKVESAREYVSAHFAELALAAEAVHANLASIAAKRMAEALKDINQIIMMDQIRASIEDVESRLRDELQSVSLFVLNAQESSLLSNANTLSSGWDINSFYPDAARELEESAKCLAFERPTASVFHSMRMLEVGLKSLAVHLKITDHTDPAKRNWGAMLKEINEKIEISFDRGSHQREQHERLFASLDAVRNPWRNGSMHVTSFYAGPEALHILRCSLFFLQMLASVTHPSEVSEPEHRTVFD